MSVLPLRHDDAAPADLAELTLAWTRALVEDAPDAAVRRHALEAARDAVREDAPAPIDRLSAIFNLSPFDEDLLLLAFAVATDAAIGFRIAARRDVPGVPHVTAQLALALLAGPDAETRALAVRLLSPTGPLRAFALLIAMDEQVSASTPLILDERISRYLLGEDYPDPRVASALRPLRGGTPPAATADALASIASALASDSPVAVVLGPKASGRRALAAAAAAHLGLSAQALRPEALPSDPAHLRSTLALVAREAALARLALVIDASQDEDASSPATILVEALVASPPAPIILVAEQRPAYALAAPGVRLPALSADDRAELWHAALGSVTPEAETAADRFGVGPAEIAAIAGRIASPTALWDECRDLAAASLGQFATRIVPRYDWDDLVLPQAVIDQLRALGDALSHRSAVFDRGGFGRKHARARGVAALFAGPSGTGKTMAAEVLASSLGIDLYRVDLSQVISKYIGETEKNLAHVFNAAEAGGAVLLFDEADALFGKRSEVKDAHDRYANVEVSYLLQRMETYGGLAILATNLKAHLDVAFLRRLRHVIDFPHPDPTLRRMLWARVFPPETATETLDLDLLSRIDVAGGNILVIAINAAFHAAAEARPVAMRDIARAAKDEFAKLDREFRCPW